MARFHSTAKYNRIALLLRAGRSVREAARVARVSKSVAGRVNLRVLATGLGPPLARRGTLHRGRKLNSWFMTAVEVLFTSPETESMYLDEAARALQKYSSRWLTKMDISRALKQLNITRKKKHTRFREACKAAQELFRATIRKVACKEMIIWTDESAVDSRTTQREYGRAKSGFRTQGLSTKNRGQRYSMVPVVTCAGLLDWYICPGSVNKERFIDFTRQCLVPYLRPYPGPCSVVVMDNFVTHKAPEVVELIEGTGALLFFLPPYSPEYNPAELVFSKAKLYMRREGDRLVSEVGADWAIHEALSSVEGKDCDAYATKCGYV